MQLGLTGIGTFGLQWGQNYVGPALFNNIDHDKILSIDENEGEKAQDSVCSVDDYVPLTGIATCRGTLHASHSALSAFPHEHIIKIIFYVDIAFFYRKANIQHRWSNILQTRIWQGHAKTSQERRGISSTIYQPLGQGPCRSGVHGITGKVYVEYWRGYIEY